jgi:hypothetical protein
MKIVVDYQEEVEWMVRLGITGRGIYDSLIAKAALKSAVDSLVTFNRREP